MQYVRVDEEDEDGKNSFPTEYGEYKEGEAPMDETPAHAFDKEQPIK